MSIAKKMEEAALDKEARHIVPLSGGKDSTALAIYLSHTYPDLPFEYVFSDTGAELPETYEYFERLEHILGKKVTRITALEMLGVSEKHGRSPFDVILYEHYSGFLPSPRSRWCTRMLKIHPFEKYVGSDKAYSYIAIRADENRSGYLGKASPSFCQKNRISRQSIPSRMTGSRSEMFSACSTTRALDFLNIMNGARAQAATSASTNSSATGSA